MGGGRRGTGLRTPGGRIRLGWRLLLYLGIVAALAIAGGMVAPAGGIVAGTIVLLVAAVVAGWVLLALDGRGPAALGFHLAPSVPGEVVRGLGLGAAAALAVVAVLALSGAVAFTADGGSLWGWLHTGLAMAAFLALPAAAEEALLRGYPLQALAEAWGEGRALWATSVVFGALHLQNPGATPLGTANVVLAGLFLGAVYLRTGSLWWASGAHLGWNWAHGFLVDLPVSGLDRWDVPLVDAALRGPAWLSGGSFGPEGSVAATLVVAGAALWSWRGGWLRREPAAMAAQPLIAEGGDR